MQVYRDLRIITARPTPEDEARVPHRLYGHVDAAENYSVGRWCADAARGDRSRLRRDGLLPILVGGTGLYFKALTQGLSAVPPTPPEIRAAVRARCDAEGAPALHAELVAPRSGDGGAAHGPATARASPARSKCWRRPAVRSPTGTATACRPSSIRDAAMKIFLVPERAELHRRIDARFDAMIAAGALDEVRALDARGLDPMLPAMKAHGVPWLRRHLHGEITLVEAAEGGKLDTRRYTKRQATWFRHQMPGWDWVAPDSAERMVSATSAG